MIIKNSFEEFMGNLAHNIQMIPETIDERYREEYTIAITMDILREFILSKIGRAHV